MRHSFIYSALFTTALATSFTATAGTNLEPVFVTATRTPLTVNSALAATTVLTRRDIELSQANSLPELLTGKSGIDMSISGGYGKQSTLSLRGTNTNHTLFLIDGVNIGSATNGSTAFQHIPLELVEQIEIVRGPRSSLYGSQAIGGVINVITRKGSKNTRGHLSASSGSEDTYELNSGISGSTGNAELSLNASIFKTEGIDANVKRNADNDAYENRSFNASFTDKVSDKLEFGLNLLHVQAHSDYDGYTASKTYMSETQQNILNSNIKTFLTNNWDSSLHVSASRDEESHYTDNVFSDQFDTSRVKTSWQNDIHLDKNVITLGYEHIQEKIDSSSTFTQTSRIKKAAFAEIQSQFSSQDLVVSLRQENDESFGHHKTGNIDWRYTLNENYSISAAYGTAFNSPTFNDLYFPFTDYSFPPYFYYSFVGNPDLLPEESSSTELGFRFIQDDWKLDIRLYKTTITNLINLSGYIDGGDPETKINIGKASIDGIETALSTVIADWDIQLNIDLLDPVDTSTDKVLRRRAKQVGSLAVDRNFGSYSIGATVSASGRKYDDNENTDEIAGHGRTDIRTTLKLDKNLMLKAKIDNLFDREYQTTKDYNSLGKMIFVSMHLSFE
ncbi:MAG: TonB-dependent receptor [Gammaproteobacteria bacterium]|nr:TonB-dependent receptor [Gammaproteobacteria bacterium]